MKRILQIVDSMGLGGIQSFIMNVYRSIDREKIQFDFLLHHRPNNSYDEEILKMGGKIFYLPARNEGINKNRRALYEFFKNHKEYEVVHEHESSLSYIEPFVAAKKNGVPVRIIHSHNTKMTGNIMHNILHKLHSFDIDKVATHYLACGELAGQWMYGKSKVKDKFCIIYNGIRLKDYEYNDEIRKNMRVAFGIKNEIVVGHAGRFMEVKNHKFLLDIFKEFHGNYGDSLLILAGDGDLYDDIQKYAKDIGISDYVKFLGMRNDIEKVIQAMDVMVIPSLYEGFPVIAIEAQANGLPVYLSDTITKEAVIKDNVHIVKLESTAKEWERSIRSDLRRITDNQILYDKGFDVNDVAKKLANLYINGNI